MHSAASPDDFLLRCHFVYEVKMLQETYRLCRNEVRNDSANEKKITNNALIESFCVHARNLIEFLQDKPSMKVYADQKYKAFFSVGNDRISTIYGRLCAQISHLVYKGTQDRAVDASDKINAGERAEILDILRAEIIEFKRNLLPDYVQLGTLIPVPASPVVIPLGVGFDATTSTTDFVVVGMFFTPPRTC